MEFLKKLFGGGVASRNTGLGRNEPCWCGSGKKYKKCHWDRDRQWLQGRNRQCATN